jgi:uncharacterized protein YndB with AHSA1/START domain
MTPITVTTHLDASPAEVWAHLRDIASHVEWMADAETIRFRTDQTTGEGTTFECDTKIGPIRLTDVMEITEWEPERTMGVRHTGVVTGVGRFALAPSARGGTTLTWTEELRFPWWLAGTLGERVGAPVLQRIWAGNLARLQSLVDTDT